MNEEERRQLLSLQGLLLKIKGLIDEYLKQHVLNSKKDRD